jgi:hypothetical protein
MIPKIVVDHGISPIMPTWITGLYVVYHIYELTANVVYHIYELTAKLIISDTIPNVKRTLSDLINPLSSNS